MNADAYNPARAADDLNADAKESIKRHIDTLQSMYTNLMTIMESLPSGWERNSLSEAITRCYDSERCLTPLVQP